MSRTRRGGMPVRFLLPFIGVIVLLVAYTAYWLYAQGQIRQSALAWIDLQRQSGYEIEHAPVRVGGYPFRFEVRIAQATVATPEAVEGWTLQTGSAVAVAMPYDFSHWIVEIPDPMTIAFDRGGEYRLASQTTRFSVRAGQGGTQRIAIEIDDLGIETLSGPPATVERVGHLRLISQLTGEDTLDTQLAAGAIALGNVALDEALVDELGTEIGLVRLELSVTHWSDLVREARTDQWVDADGRVEITESGIDWGSVAFRAEGSLTVDPAGYPDGRVSLFVLDPEALADVLVASGTVRGENENALRLLAQSAPRGERGTAVPLTLRSGGIYLGPVRIGDLQRVGG
ncbi:MULTISPECIES: DUF2125 domain-containing protein [Hyphobacterium]|uniref:DUF2125 domain-containing protein n=1 Tax=Hyphobacterium vulgare TaxID=1736751 RepID=A0ABV6ZYV0_9PROT